MSAWAPGARALKSTADVIAMAGISEALLDVCNVRCGIGDLKPLREAVHNMLRGTVMRFCSVVPAFILRVCLKQAIETVDRILVGITRRTLRRYIDHSFVRSFLLHYLRRSFMPPDQRVAVL